MNCRFEIDPQGTSTEKGVAMVCQVCGRPHHSFTAVERIHRRCLGTADRLARVLAIVAGHCVDYRPEISEHAAKRAAWCVAECPEFGVLRCSRYTGCRADQAWVAVLVAGLCKRWPAELERPVV